MATEAPEPADDLTKPLGQKKAKRKRFVIPAYWVTRAIAGALSICVAVLASWILFVDEPFGGEPVVIVSADTRDSPNAGKGKTGAAEPGKTETAPTVTSADPGKSGGPTVTIIDGSTGTRKEIQVAPTAAPAAKQGMPKEEPRSETKIEQRFLENSRHGTIPKIAPDGVRPSEIYAKPVKPQASAGTPRIAIVVSGLGVSQSGTSEALSKLPPEVTYSFAPYGADLERWVARARREGHEVLLQVGMEPFDFPDNDPGPKTLLTSLSPEQNIDRLHWFMSRFQGYVGVTSLMGQRFTATDQSLLPVLREVGKRGLIYFDDGSSPRSIAGQISGAHSIAFARADAVLDAVPTGKDIDSALARLEATARNRGVAVASASALPVTIDRIANWARGADARGIALVPISAVANRAKTSS
jgi:polysaccharide deacetylase 2 family uncharacterized protein YibQ